MKIGVPTEVKNNEHRVGLTPDSVRALTEFGHQVFIQSAAGQAVGFTDELYKLSGATILNNASDVFNSSELVIKVKEPTEQEFQFLREDLTLLTYLHLAGDLANAHKQCWILALLALLMRPLLQVTMAAAIAGSNERNRRSAKLCGGKSYHLLKPNNGLRYLGWRS